MGCLLVPLTHGMVLNKIMNLLGAPLVPRGERAEYIICEVQIPHNTMKITLYKNFLRTLQILDCLHLWFYPQKQQRQKI